VGEIRFVPRRVLTYIDLMPDQMRSYLDFEKPVAELDSKVDELRALATGGTDSAKRFRGSRKRRRRRLPSCMPI